MFDKTNKTIMFCFFVEHQDGCCTLQLSRLERHDVITSVVEGERDSVAGAVAAVASRKHRVAVFSGSYLILHPILPYLHHFLQHTDVIVSGEFGR